VRKYLMLKTLWIMIARGSGGRVHYAAMREQETAILKNMSFEELFFFNDTLTMLHGDVKHAAATKARKKLEQAKKEGQGVLSQE